MQIIINPGTGPVGDEASIKNAVANMKAFVADVAEYEGEPATWRRGNPADDEGDGRFAFLVTCRGREQSVDMPGLPLERVRYLGKPEQNIWHFPRLYVDGNSWVWKFAIHMWSPEDE